MSTNARNQRLENVLGWLQTAKENFPAINNNAVPSDRIAALSELLDRMQRVALALTVDVSASRAPHRPAGLPERRGVIVAPQARG
ncbi:MAG TPA: hypothetical protein VGP07_20065 [Polyangia bacterium]